MLPRVRAARRLLAACPMEAQRVSVDDEPYNAVTELAHEVLTDFVDGRVERCRRVLDEVERLLAEPHDADARELVIVGFIEDVQNASLHGSIPLARWEPLLRPLTIEAWRAVHDFWQRRTTAAAFHKYVQGRATDAG